MFDIFLHLEKHYPFLALVTPPSSGCSSQFPLLNNILELKPESTPLTLHPLIGQWSSTLGVHLNHMDPNARDSN